MFWFWELKSTNTGIGALNGMLNTNTYYLYFCNTANLQGICTESGDCAHIAGAYCDTTAKQCKCGAAYLAGTAGETNCVGISKYDVYYKNTLFPIGHIK